MFRSQFVHEFHVLYCVENEETPQSKVLKETTPMLFGMTINTVWSSKHGWNITRQTLCKYKLSLLWGCLCITLTAMKIPKKVVASKMCIIRVTTFQAPLQSLCVCVFETNTIKQIFISHWIGLWSWNFPKTVLNFLSEEKKSYISNF
jgi:hypothetical protein